MKGNAIMKTVFYLTLIARIRADKLDEAIASAIFEPKSTACTGSSATTSFSTSYTSTFSISKWDVNNAKWEENVFEVDIGHTDTNPDRSWTIRIGKGGQISSFLVAAGEAISNQANDKAIWNDLVQQMVAVNEDLNKPATPNFIHQAGPYAKDSGMPPPFYSPKVALHCSEDFCSTVNWGQQAHVPTKFDSPLLYYTRYRNCGDGVIEYDMAMHHFGKVSTDVYKYFNTPWTGVRTSTFHDMMISNTAGQLEPVFPMPSWGDNLKDLDQTGGFTTFAEDLEVADDTFTFPFCVDTTKVSPTPANAPCSAGNSNLQPFTLKVMENSTAQQTGHATTYGLTYTVRMMLCDLNAPISLNLPGWGNPGEGVLLTNSRTGFTFQSDFLIHPCWLDGSTKYTYLSSNVTTTKLNQEFITGDEISIKYVKSGKPLDSQKAFTFVHGKNTEYKVSLSWYRSKSRIRYGATNMRRDGTVWTTNWLGKLQQTETYFNRKFIVTDKLSNMESIGSQLSGSTFEDVAKINELKDGEVIKLWMNADSFGATIASEHCAAAAATLACTGSSVPKAGYEPWFYITTGERKATTTDPYHFAAVSADGYKVPYISYDENNVLTRSSWKLLGFFGTDCASLAEREYVSSFCTGKWGDRVVCRADQPQRFLGFDGPFS